MKLRLNHFNFIPCLFGVVIAMLLGNVQAQKASIPAAFRLMCTGTHGR